MFDATYDPWRAFDGHSRFVGTAGTGWASANNLYSADGTYAGSTQTNTYPGEYLDLQLPCAIHLTAYAVCNRDDGDAAYLIPQSPSRWVVLGSSSGGATWTTLDTRTQTWTDCGLCYTYSVAGASSSFTQLRLVVSAIGANAPAIQASGIVAHWNLYGTTATLSPPPPPCVFAPPSLAPSLSASAGKPKATQLCGVRRSYPTVLPDGVSRRSLLITR